MSEQWRIFVVEDEESLNRSIVTSLRKDGYIVNGATNGRDAVRILWTQEHDVVICDLKTPGADGFELLQWLRAYRPNTRVILVGGGGDAVRTQALEGGAVSYLEKPLDLHLLKEELRRLLVQTGFSASLDSFDLLDVIQIVSTSRKSIALLVSTGLEEHGMLCFQNGDLVWAEYGMLRGEEAFFALAAHKNGTVIHQPWNQRVTPNVTQPLSRLILQSLQYRTKYSQMQQLSGEQEVLPTSSTEQDDDSPFVVLAEYTEPPGSREKMGQQEASQQALGASTFQEQEEPGASDAGGAESTAKEWWEQTDKYSKSKTDSTNVRSVPVTPFFSASLSESTAAKRVPPGMRKTQMRSGNTENSTTHEALPSWLTDQPTAMELPNVRSSSSSDSQQIPGVASTPSFQPVPAEWQPPAQPFQAVHASQKDTEQIAKKTTGFQNSLATNRVAPGTSSAEWQPPAVTEPVQNSPMPNLISLHETRDALPLQGVQKEDRSSQNNWNSQETYRMEMPDIQRATRRNHDYAALVSALQTLGYSVPDFLAAAVVSIDGQLIAQVTVDDQDISNLCKNFSTLMKSVLQFLDQSEWGVHENTGITSRNRRILMRVVGNGKNAFQVLITTPNADPTQSVEAMVNVEEAIVAALRH